MNTKLTQIMNQVSSPLRIAIPLTLATVMAAYVATKAIADDVSAPINVTLITSQDTDGDGLTNSQEISSGRTNPNNSDSNGNGFNDGIEVINYPSGNPSFGSGHALYNLNKIRKITTGSSTNKFSPVWMLGGWMAYIESATDFSDSKMWVKNLSKLSTPRTELVDALELGLMELAAGPLGLNVYFHKDNGSGQQAIYKVNRITGNVTKAIPEAGAVPPNLPIGLSNVSIFANYSVISDSQNPDNAQLVASNVWAIADATNGQIYGFKLRTTGVRSGMMDSSVDPVQITIFSNRVGRPKVSRDGDKIMIQEIDSLGKTQLRLYNGLNNILIGAASPYLQNNSSDLRGEAITFFNNGVAFPAGFGGANNIAYFVQDSSNNYRLTNPLNFSNANFDICLTPIGITPSGRFSMVQPGKRIIPIPGNQITPSISIEGARIAFADDYLNYSEGSFNMYIASVRAGAIIYDNQQADDMFSALTKYFDTSGLTIIGLANSTISSPTPETVLSAEYLLDPIRDATETASLLTTRRRFEPAGLQFTSGLGWQVRNRYSISDRVVQDASGNTVLLDDNTFTPVYEMADGSTVSAASDIIARSTAEGYIDMNIHHFSDISLQGQTVPLILGEEQQLPSAIKKEMWELLK